MSLLSKLAQASGGIGAAMSHPTYRQYWFGNMSAQIGRWMQRVAVTWLAWELTESFAWLGAVGFAETFPLVLFSLLGGAVADRLGYLRVMRIYQVLIALISVGIGVLALAGLMTIELLLGMVLIYGIVEALLGPPRIAIIHSLVPKKDVSPAIALNSVTFNSARFIGPAIAGPLIIALGAGWVVVFAAFAYFGFYLVLLRVTDQPEKLEGDPDTSMLGRIWRDMKNGLAYGARHPGIRFIFIAMGSTGILIRPYIDLVAGASDKVFNMGPDGQAILLSATGLGAVLGAVWIARRGRTEGMTGLVLTSLWVTSLALILFNLTTNIWLGAAAVLIVGMFMLIGGISATTLTQTMAQADMRGRVMGLYMLIAWGMPAVGALVMGWIASFAGLQWTLGIGAALLLAVWLWARPVGRKLSAEIEAPPDPDTPEDGIGPKPATPAPSSAP